MTAQQIAHAINRIDLNRVQAQVIGPEPAPMIRVRDFRSFGPLTGIARRPGVFVTISPERAAELFGLTEPEPASQDRAGCTISWVGGSSDRG